MRRSTHSRSGFTLVEMMLVVGVIVVFAGMTMPSVMRMFSQQKLTASAERVREAIASTRVRAIETGLVYQFCYESNGGHYVVVPFEPDHMKSPPGSSTGGVVLASRGTGMLPNGLVFGATTMGNASSSVAPPATQQLSADALEGLPNAGDLAGLNWSPPILFTPEGSASADTLFEVRDSRSQFVLLRIRAFTGAVSMDRVTVRKR